MRILVSGASGFVGKALVSYLAAKRCEAVPLTHEFGAAGQYKWRAASGSLEDFDAAVHLAGEPLSLGRWSAEKKRMILASRKEGTSALSLALARLRRPPPVFISASAVGYYGNRGETLLDEGSGSGEGFLAEVCREWEEASRSIENRGARTVRARFGMVLGPDGGALQKIVPVYRWGLGGKLGSGNQWVSWVALADLIRALDHLLHTDSLHGPVNVVSPQSVRQQEWSGTLAQLLGRPAFLRLPAWLLRLRFGEAAEGLLLASARVVPQKLCSSGFSFKYLAIRDALKYSLYVDK